MSRTLQPEAALHQAEGWGGEVQQLFVEALVGVARAPRRLRLLAEAEDLELSPRVAGGFAARRRALQVSVLGEAAGGLVHRHLAGVDADRDGEARDADEGLDGDTGGEAGILGAEPLVDAQLLDVMRPPLDERQGQQALADVSARTAQDPAVSEVPGCDLVHG